MLRFKESDADLFVKHVERNLPLDVGRETSLPVDELAFLDGDDEEFNIELASVPSLRPRTRSSKGKEDTNFDFFEKSSTPPFRSNPTRSSRRKSSYKEEEEEREASPPRHVAPYPSRK